jgi:hypothetical protein
MIVSPAARERSVLVHLAGRRKDVRRVRDLRWPAARRRARRRAHLPWLPLSDRGLVASSRPVFSIPHEPSPQCRLGGTGSKESGGSLAPGASQNVTTTRTRTRRGARISDGRFSLGPIKSPSLMTVSAFGTLNTSSCGSIRTRSPRRNVRAMRRSLPVQAEPDLRRERRQDDNRAAGTSCRVGAQSRHDPQMSGIGRRCVRTPGVS